ncbi:TetR/AcrR family transcriptional regulator [Lacticaseibacillus pantheris]|uniref:TetR/AcrR family transcriptional regulator n=1 Tax=Lacticaseibacillus pantheris TaxID=171523 RepID=UPI0026588D2F|nr:TetR/AcrR family transcriptional regulator [Lacticaseibacillus pantheris]WKF85849.1 TetR/AcrR family transcriptional regulator [Lacticaseibacillus pantheris]
MSDHNQHPEQIIAIAKKLFAEKGFASTTTRELNSALGITDGLLYYYFPKGNQQLLDTILEQTDDDCLAAIDISFAHSPYLASLEVNVIQVITAIWHRLTDSGPVYELFITIREYQHLNKHAVDWISNSFAKLTARFANELKQVSWLTLNSTENDVVADMIVTLCRASIENTLLLTENRHLSPRLADRLKNQIHVILSRSVR